MVSLDTYVSGVREDRTRVTASGERPVAATTKVSKYRPVPSSDSGRALLTAIFLVSGVGKIAAPAATLDYITSVGLPAPQIAYAGALLIELVVGTLLLIG